MKQLNFQGKASWRQCIIMLLQHDYEECDEDGDDDNVDDDLLMMVVVVRLLPLQEYATQRAG